MLTMNEFHTVTFCLPNVTNSCQLPGTEVLDERGLDYATAWDMWKNFFALTMMAIGFLLFAYIQLVRIKKTK
jgi:hypothetical protein